jgi:hypothetical protein
MAKIFDFCRLNVSSKRVYHENGIMLLETTIVIGGKSLDPREE